MLRFDSKQQNSVKQLSLNKKIKRKKKDERVKERITYGLSGLGTTKLLWQPNLRRQSWISTPELCTT